MTFRKFSTDLCELPDDVGRVVHVGLQRLALRLQLLPHFLLAALPLLRLLRQPRLALLEAGDHVLANLNVSESQNINLSNYTAYDVMAENYSSFIFLTPLLKLPQVRQNLHYKNKAQGIDT